MSNKCSLTQVHAQEEWNPLVHLCRNLKTSMFCPAL